MSTSRRCHPNRSRAPAQGHATQYRVDVPTDAPERQLQGQLATACQQRIPCAKLPREGPQGAVTGTPTLFRQIEEPYTVMETKMVAIQVPQTVMQAKWIQEPREISIPRQIVEKRIIKALPKMVKWRKNTSTRSNRAAVHRGSPHRDQAGCCGG